MIGKELVEFSLIGGLVKVLTTFSLYFFCIAVQKIQRQQRMNKANL